MSEREQQKPSGEPGRGLRCDEWVDRIADALDGTLTAADAAAFTRHHGECALCAQMLKETHQGKAWMEYLAVEPEVPAGLLEKILARTSEPPVPGIAMPALAVPARPAWHRVALPVVRQAARQVLEPRLMMTVAMAFFSIALTLNLTGIKLTELRPSDFQPSRVKANLTRQYYSTNLQVTKYYENLRLVYEMEARVRELRRSTESEPAGTPSPNETPKQPARDGTGSPSSTVPRTGTPMPQPRPLKGDSLPPAEMVHALPQSMYPPQALRAAPLQVPASFDRTGGRKTVKREVFRALRSTTEDQAERSLV
jgi:Putative zinc-finger